MNSLEKLWTSTARLYKRFDLDVYTTPAWKRRRIFMEEVTELIEVSTAQVCDGDALDLANEAADVVVTVMGLLQAHGVNEQAFLDAINAVTAKNDSKTHATHELVNGKITRKAVQREP